MPEAISMLSKFRYIDETNMEMAGCSQVAAAL